LSVAWAGEVGPFENILTDALGFPVGIIFQFLAHLGVYHNLCQFNYRVEIGQLLLRDMIIKILSHRRG
jgi:hypothetical protein